MSSEYPEDYVTGMDFVDINFFVIMMFLLQGLKDENAPKLPQTGYVMYMNERRDVIKNETPNISFPDLTKKIASEWSNMDPATKKVICCFQLWPEGVSPPWESSNSRHHRS